MEKIMILLGLSPITQIITLILLGTVSMVWWIYSKALKDISSKEMVERKMLEHFYDPAITLIKLKKSKRISKGDFESRFCNLLVSNMTNVLSKETEMKLNSWIDGEDNITDLSSLLESDRINISKRLHRFPVRKIFSWLGDEITIYLLLYVFFWTAILVTSIGSYKIILLYGVKVYLISLYSLILFMMVAFGILYRRIKTREKNNQS